MPGPSPGTKRCGTGKPRSSLTEAKEAFAEGDAEAKEAYLKALHYSPDSAAAHLSLARIYKGEKNFPTPSFTSRPRKAGIRKRRGPERVRRNAV